MILLILDITNVYIDFNTKAVVQLAVVIFSQEVKNLGFAVSLWSFNIYLDLN